MASTHIAFGVGEGSLEAPVLTYSTSTTDVRVQPVTGWLPYAEAEKVMMALVIASNWILTPEKRAAWHAGYPLLLRAWAFLRANEDLIRWAFCWVQGDTTNAERVIKNPRGTTRSLGCSSRGCAIYLAASDEGNCSQEVAGNLLHELGHATGAVDHDPGGPGGCHDSYIVESTFYYTALSRFPEVAGRNCSSVCRILPSRVVLLFASDEDENVSEYPGYVYPEFERAECGEVTP